MSGFGNYIRHGTGIDKIVLSRDLKMTTRTPDDEWLNTKEASLGTAYIEFDAKKYRIHSVPPSDHPFVSATLTLPATGEMKSVDEGSVDTLLESVGKRLGERRSSMRAELAIKLLKHAEIF